MNKHRWNVHLTTETGETHNVTFVAAWDPTKDFVSSESVARAAAAQEYVKHGKRVSFIPVSATLLDEAA